MRQAKLGGQLVYAQFDLEAARMIDGDHRQVGSDATVETIADDSCGQGDSLVLQRRGSKYTTVPLLRSLLISDCIRCYDGQIEDHFVDDLTGTRALLEHRKEEDSSYELTRLHP